MVALDRVAFKKPERKPDRAEAKVTCHILTKTVDRR